MRGLIRDLESIGPSSLPLGGERPALVDCITAKVGFSIKDLPPIKAVQSALLALRGGGQVITGWGRLIPSTMFFKLYLLFENILSDYFTHSSLPWYVV
jgi:hypothetical protein